MLTSTRPEDGRSQDLGTFSSRDRFSSEQEQTESVGTQPIRTLAQRCERIDQVLITLHRSLLQYADLCWPWVDEDESDERNLLRMLASRQNDGVRGLVLLLDQRGWPVDYGLYPDHYTDFNYVALEHLWPLIVSEEQSRLAELHEIRQDLCGDTEAETVLDRCIEIQRDITAALKNHSPGSADRAQSNSTAQDPRSTHTREQPS